jgi:two-component system NtrC family sensor kinase
MVFRDVTEQKRLQKQLEVADRLASLGTMAAGVAHEINNPLTGTLTFTHLLLRRTDLPPEVHSDLEVIARSTARVRDIVRGLLDFARQTQLKPEPMDINELVQGTLALVENQALVKGVELSFDPGPGIPRRTLDKSQMQSVIMNIVLNALDATEAGGTITVSTALAVTTESPLEDGAPHPAVQIVVSDTGCGIPPENLPRLFDPFFTTKEVGKGTGLGLSVSLGIVEKHEGTIRVTSTVGRGSTFVILLPLDEGRH